MTYIVDYCIDSIMIDCSLRTSYAVKLRVVMHIVNVCNNLTTISASITMLAYYCFCFVVCW